MAFSVTPDSMIGMRTRVLPPDYAEGWLVFECADERRRLAPFPAEWKNCSETELCRLVGRAERVRRRSPHTDVLSQSQIDPPADVL